MGRVSALLFASLVLSALPVRTSAEERLTKPAPTTASPGEPATDGLSGQFEWPCRLGTPREMRRRILELWTVSPTFRGQCLRLAEANITVAVGFSALLRPGLRAASKILRRNGRVFFVSTTLRDDIHLEEDLPHELEHAIEQIEARNLAVDAAGGRGAWSSGTGAYETERARLAGIRAWNEVQDARESGSRDPVFARAVLAHPRH